jgi:hypothetical protein
MIRRRVSATDHVRMPLAIRCHPCVPVALPEIEAWLEREVGRIRDEAPGATVRLLRLSQELPSGDHSVGWLIELEVEVSLVETGLAAVLSEMRLLGLQPTVLETVARRAAVLRDPRRGDGGPLEGISTSA